MKKLFSIILVIAMLCMMSVNVFAAETTGKTITMTGATGHSYEVYQIFVGDVSKEGESLVLSNIKYGENFGTKGTAPDATLLESYMAMDGATLAKNLFAGKHGDPVATLNADNSWTVTGMATGYYLIVDVTTNVPDGETKSPLILEVVEDVTVASKHAGVTSEKKVDDKNDSNNSEDAVKWQDSADYDIGDAVPFKISATLPTTFNNYATYELTFHDKQAEGFSAPTITSVYYATADGTKVAEIDASQYKLTTGACGNTECDYGDDCSFSVKFTDLKQVITNYVEGYQIVVEYTSVLESDAAIGIAGNENSMYVCHPDGHTPEDTVIVFTYKLGADKIDGATGDALTGASFELFKWIADASETDGGYWKSLGEVSGAEGSHFAWPGIDDGTYKLVETKTPAGYNTMPDHIFTITALHKENWTKGTDGSAFEDLATDGTVFRDYYEVKNDPKDGVLVGDLVNNKGTVLPETGAMGTMIFITTGTLLAMVAVVFMVTRKKMSIYED